MLSRPITAGWFTVALLLATTIAARGAQPLPDANHVLPAETLAPMVSAGDFTSEAGFFARWRASHQQRATYGGWIETDRPSFTLSSTTVPRGWLQLESGYTYAYSNYEDSIFESVFNTHTLPELNLRWGLTDRLELRFLWGGLQYLNLEETDWFWPWGSSTWHYSDTRISNTSLGLKYQVSRNDGWIPQSALVTELSIPTGDGYDEVAPLVDYIYEWYLTKRISLGGSSGAFFSGFWDVSVMQYFQSAILRFHYSPRITLFCEWFGVFQEPPELGGYPYSDSIEFHPYFDAGFQFRPLANVQLDFKIGLPLPEQYQPEGLFTGCGLSFRY